MEAAMKQKILAAMATLMLGMATYAHADETIAIKAGYMMLTPSGQFAATVNNTGTRINLEQDLNLDNSKQLTGEVGISLIIYPGLYSPELHRQWHACTLNYLQRSNIYGWHYCSK
jgi:hypothetical protein